MLITTQNEIISLMPTAKWDRPSQLLGYLEEEERVALEPLLGTELYMHICNEYVDLRDKYDDLTSATIRPTGEAKEDPALAYADVTERLEQIQAGTFGAPYSGASEGNMEVEEEEMQTIRLIRLCQQIEFYKMLSHKAGLLTVSFNEGGGMNMVSADGYEPADEKRMERAVRDAYMSAGRSVDSLLLMLEADAKTKQQFTKLWSKADAFYLHKDLLFQTARVLNEYLDINGERLAYVALVRDIRFCQNTYVKPRVGAKLLKAVVEYANNGMQDSSDSSSDTIDTFVYDELLSMLRTALAFYVESRRTSVDDKKLARRDSMTDAQQAMASACEFIEENLDALGEAAVDCPMYRSVRARKEQLDAFRKAEQQKHHDKVVQNRKKLFTAFPVTHRGNPYDK